MTHTTPPAAVIFDLGGTLVHWPDWDDAAPLRWGASYDRLVQALSRENRPSRDAYVRAMREAELAHRRRTAGRRVAMCRATLGRSGTALVALGERLQAGWPMPAASG
jgi:FMN phosphatase YigB (HAD superfamily)